MPRPRISAIIVTRNESLRIRTCLESIKWVDEIVAVDQSSEDNTVEILRRYTDKVFVVENKGFCEPDRITAVSKAQNEWILYVDADEVVSPELMQEIERVLAQNKDSGCFYIPRKNIFLGRWIRGSGWYPGYVLRLFKKGAVRLPQDIHADITALATCGYLKNAIIHQTAEDLEEYLRKVNRYTTVLARQAYEKGGRITAKNMFSRIFLLPLAYVLQKFVLKNGFIDGYYGLLIAFLTGLTVFLMQVKLWELQRKRERSA
jgi:glycosyltransferase involved in cell wall biosynthesis